jgi:hypothetical protein
MEVDVVEVQAEKGHHAHLFALVMVLAWMPLVMLLGCLLVMLLGCDNPKAREHAEGALVRLSIDSANRNLIVKKQTELSLVNFSTKHRSRHIQPIFGFPINPKVRKKNLSFFCRFNVVPFGIGSSR